MARLFSRAAGDVLTPAGAFPDVTTKLSMSCWYKLDQAVSGGYTIVSKGTAGNTFDRNFGFDLRSYAGEQIEAYWTQPAGSFAQYTFDTTFDTGVWHHVCWSIDWTQNPYVVHLWVDGDEKTLGNSGPTSGAPTTGAAQVTYIGDIHATGDHFDGTLAELALWAGTALGAAHAAALAKGAPVTSVGIQPTGYWPLWGVASPEPDLSGSGYHATVTGATAADHAPVGPHVVQVPWAYEAAFAAAAAAAAFPPPPRFRGFQHMVIR